MLTSFVGLVRLPNNFAAELFVGEQGRTLGWGRTSVNGPTSSTLMQSMNIVMDNAACAQALGADRVIAATICVQASLGGPCQADEGGVLTVVRAGDPRPNVQIGIVSSFHPTACLGHPVAYTRVTQFLGWIAGHSNPTF